MSHLTEFSLILANVERLLGGEVPDWRIHHDHGQFGGVAVRFPLIGTPPLSQVGEFYSSLNFEVERSRLRRERKMAYRQFISAAYLAHHACEKHQPQTGSIYHLRGCIAYISRALRLMEMSKEYDDDQPVHWSEVYRTESTQDITPPEEYWLLFKLHSLWPVLRLSVRVLRLAFPYCLPTWEEWDASLCQKEWLQQFILDSRTSWRNVPLHPPRLIDIVGRKSLETL